MQINIINIIPYEVPENIHAFDLFKHDLPVHSFAPQEIEPYTKITLEIRKLAYRQFGSIKYKEFNVAFYNTDPERQNLLIDYINALHQEIRKLKEWSDLIKNIAVRMENKYLNENIIDFIKRKIKQKFKK